MCGQVVSAKKSKKSNESAFFFKEDYGNLEQIGHEKRKLKDVAPRDCKVVEEVDLETALQRDLETLRYISRLYRHQITPASCRLTLIYTSYFVEDIGKKDKHLGLSDIERHIRKVHSRVMFIRVIPKSCRAYFIRLVNILDYVLVITLFYKNTVDTCETKLRTSIAELLRDVLFYYIVQQKK